MCFHEDTEKAKILNIDFVVLACVRIELTTLALLAPRSAD